MSCQGCWWAVCSPFSLLSNDIETTSFRRSSSRLQELSAAVTMELLYFYALAHQTSFDVRWLKKGTVAWICFFFFFVIFVTDWDLPWVNHHHEVNPPFWEKIFGPTFFHPHHNFKQNLRLVKPWWNLGEIDGSMAFLRAGWVGIWQKGGWLIDLHPEGRCLPLKKVDKAQFVEKTHRKVWKEQKVLKKLKLHLFMRIFCFGFHM